MPQAVQEAYNHNVCICAAPSNYSNKLGVMFPAIQSRHVFAAFAANAQQADGGKAAQLKPGA